MDMPSPIPLWIDADPSGLVWTGLDCDDDIAVLVALALEKRRYIDLQGISICGGNAPLQHTWPDIHRLLEHAGYTKLTPIKGYGWRSMYILSKLIRVINFFSPDLQDSEAAADALIETAKRSTNHPFNILMLGPTTNLARAVEKGLGFSGINHVYLMGGELTGQSMCLNFRSDRAAARVILESGLPKTMITIQTCGQVSVTQSHLDQYLDCPGMAACALLPKMRQQVNHMPKMVNPRVRQWLLHDKGIWKASSNLDAGFVPWDVVALFAITHPNELFERWEYFRVSIPPCSQGETCDEPMEIVEGPLLEKEFHRQSNWSGVVRIPQFVKNETELLDTMFTLLGDIPAAHSQPPQLFLGFLNTIIGVIVGFLSIFIVSFLRRRTP